MPALLFKPDHITQVRDAFRACYEFEDSTVLKSVFVGPLENYRDLFPATEGLSLGARIDCCVAFLCKENLLISFLQAIELKRKPVDPAFRLLEQARNSLQQYISQNSSTQLPQDGNEFFDLSDYLLPFAECLVMTIGNIRWLADGEYTNSLENLKLLISDLYIDAEEIEGLSSSIKATALVKYCNRRKLISQLVEVCKQFYAKNRRKDSPEIRWPDFSELENLQKNVEGEMSLQDTLARQITLYFDDSEIELLCFDLDITFEPLQPGVTRVRVAQQIILTAKQCGYMAQLQQLCEQARPFLGWNTNAGTDIVTFNERQQQNQKLRTLICERFSFSEIKELCFLAGADYEFLTEPPPKSKSLFTIKTIRYFESKGQLSQLITQTVKQRPETSWPSTLSQPSFDESGSDTLREQAKALYDLLCTNLALNELLALSLRLRLMDSFYARTEQTTKSDFALELLLECNRANKLTELENLYKNFK